MRRIGIAFWLGFAFFACHAGSASAGGPLEKSPEQVRLEQYRDIVRRWIEEGFNKRNPSVVDEIVTEGFAVNGLKIGREGLRRSMNRHLTAFPDLYVTITDSVAEGNKVAIWYSVEGTHRGEFDGIQPTGKRVSWTGVDLFRFGGGRIVEARFLSDSLGLMRQLGGVSPPPANRK